MKKEPLLSFSFCTLLGANFLLFFAFYLILPILPFYLMEYFGAGKSLIGLILSCYTIACLSIRPFSGYLIDSFARKPLYLIAFFLFTLLFGGYALASTLSLFLIFRVIHGLAFGMVTVAGNTLVIDILPSSRRGEGLGYYGLANNIAMSIGPMIGLFMHELYPYTTIFWCALLSGALGLSLGSLVKAPHKAPIVREPLSLDRFFLVKGWSAGLSLLLFSIPYGMTSSYVAMYAQEIGITTHSGLYFTAMAIGLAVSRLFSGKAVDRGRITQTILLGMVLAAASFFGLWACRLVALINIPAASFLFPAIALLQGIGFGTMFPAFNTLFVNLAPNSQRGTATSTYLTSWDVGIGIGLLSGGFLAQLLGGFHTAYLMGGVLSVASLLFFARVAAPFFNRNKVR